MIVQHKSTAIIPCNIHYKVIASAKPPLPDFLHFHAIFPCLYPFFIIVVIIHLPNWTASHFHSRQSEKKKPTHRNVWAFYIIASHSAKMLEKLFKFSSSPCLIHTLYTFFQHRKVHTVSGRLPALTQNISQALYNPLLSVPVLMLWYKQPCYHFAQWMVWYCF